MEEVRQHSPDLVGDERTPIDYWIDSWKLVRKRRRLIGVICAASVLISLLISLLLPKVYVSRATILTPRETALGGGQMSSMLSGVSQAIGGFSLTSSAPNQTTFLALLSSDTLKKAVISHFKQSRGNSVRSLLRRVRVDSPLDSGVIVVTVESADRQFAADAANFYIKTLERMVNQLWTASLERRHSSTIQQLARAKVALEESEHAFKSFQVKNKAVGLGLPVEAVPGQGEVSVGGGGGAPDGASLRGSIIMKEVQLDVLRTFLTESHQKVVTLKREILELKRAMAKEQYGKPWQLPPEEQNPGQSREELTFVPTVRRPDLQLEMIRLYRELKVHQTVYTFLTQQIQQLKLSEDNFPEVQLLDVAVPAETHFKPWILWNLSLAVVGSLILGTLLALFLDYMGRMRFLERLRGTD
ncbi:MAG: hypothetical protein HY694_05665 [Deltaproteobacteria bacterium]|nr:hypothetical protein [Deltaproteobacteria bacterium]